MISRPFVLMALAATLVASGCRDASGPEGVQASFTRLTFATPEELGAFPDSVWIESRDRITIRATAWYGCAEPVLQVRRFRQLIDVELRAEPHEPGFCADILRRVPVQIEVRVPDRGDYVVRATIVGQPRRVSKTVTVNPDWR
jgi:hypothetical protein